MVLFYLCGLGGSRAQVLPVNVVVSNSSGQMPPSLSSTDFQVFDNGKSQQLVFFHENLRKSAIPRATVILFDLMNQQAGAQSSAWQEIVRSLEQFPSAESVYLYLLTADGQTLYPVHALASSGAWMNQVRARLDSAMREVHQLKPEGKTLDDRVGQACLALETLGWQMAVVPGPKKIVWITIGLPSELGPGRVIPSVDYSPSLRRLSAALSRAGVSVYPVAISDSVSTRLQTRTALQTLAHLTGGVAYFDGGIRAAITQAVEEESAAYVLGYHSPPYDGKYHKIRVACARPGIRVQAPHGYYADSLQGGFGPLEKAALMSAVASPFDAARIGIHATASRGGVAQQVRIEIAVDVADLLLLPEGGGVSGQLDIVVVEHRGDGRRVPSVSIPLNFTMTPGQREKASKEGLKFSQNRTITGDTRELRIIVFDRGSKGIGSLTIPYRNSGNK